MINLRDYQEAIAGKAAALLKQYGIAYLAMEVRTGKTLTALSAADRYGAKKVLFLTKKRELKRVLFLMITKPYPHDLKFRS